jgi:hypothetical protein
MKGYTLDVLVQHPLAAEELMGLLKSFGLPQKSWETKTLTNFSKAHRKVGKILTVSFGLGVARLLALFSFFVLCASSRHVFPLSMYRSFRFVYTRARSRRALWSLIFAYSPLDSRLFR